jgi:predicted MPP superfamily phosphohydrolase
MKVALVCIAKNEEHYIDEWIDYHIKLGFDDVFIYQNDWRYIINNSNVHITYLDGLDKQWEAYNSFLQKNKEQYDWVAFFDVDEFLVLKQDNNVKNFLKNYSDYNAIGISWVFFGNNNHTDIKDNYSQINRFTKRQIKPDNHVKCIINTKHNLVMDIHNPNTTWVNVHKEINSGPFSRKPTDDIAQLNHYYCKTIEEFKRKCDRGRADTPFLKVSYNQYDSRNFNEIEDLTAYNFYYNDNNNIFNT